MIHITWSIVGLLTCVATESLIPWPFFVCHLDCSVSETRWKSATKRIMRVYSSSPLDTQPKTWKPQIASLLARSLFIRQIRTYLSSNEVCFPLPYPQMVIMAAYCEGRPQIHNISVAVKVRKCVRASELPWPTPNRNAYESFRSSISSDPTRPANSMPPAIPSQ